MMTVGRLRTHVRTPVPIAAARCESWHAALAEQDEAALTAGLARDDEWLLVRKLRIATQWRLDEPDVEVGRIWSTALRQAIEGALADSSNCVRYASRRAAIADMLYRSALRDRSRQWAWYRMGLTEREELGDGEAIETAVALLVREPELIWPVLQRLIAAEGATAALTAALHALPAHAWARLFAACPRTALYAQLYNKEWRANAVPADRSEDAELRTSAVAQRLIAWAAARSYFVARHADTLAVLLAALAWPATGQRTDAVRRRIDVARAQFSPAHTRVAPSSPPHPDSVEREPVEIPHTAIAEETRLAPDPEPPALPELLEPAEWQPTAFAGALLWLSRIASSGVFEWIDALADPPADALRLMLLALARALGVPDDDAALAAFCGGSVPQTEPPDEFAERAAALAAQWSAWLDEAAPDLAEPRLAAVCRRDGRLRLEPGWIEVHLPLASIETGIRRLGLDLDPGWLPWLGCVVRICYDE
jgi:hypothetical protein